MIQNSAVTKPVRTQSLAMAAPAPGFVHPVFDSQRVFRTILDCVARPGRLTPMNSSVVAPPPLLATTAEILLAMADFETSIWLDEKLACTVEVAAYLRFYTGAKITINPSQATFAVICDVASMPSFTAFAQGSPEYPDRSTTLIVQAERLAGVGHVFEGPGIDGRIAFTAEPAPPDLTRQLTANRAAYPCGVDLIFAAATTIAALPRSIRLVKD
jgi:alpha-D-ribose 1-methylphosphonate 5-triphosphate synthase subunit PhnH